MAERKYTHGLELNLDDHVIIMSIGDMEIWDGADLSLVRDTLYKLIMDDGANAIGVDVTHVQHVPSGFFGMLFDWYEKGIEIRLYNPRSRLRQMLWFRKFFKPMNDGVFRFCDGACIDEAASEELWPSDEGLAPICESAGTW